FSKSADSAICSKCGKSCGAFCTWILILSVQVMHAFLIGGKIEKIKLYVPQTAEFYKQRMGGERMRAAKPTNRETFTRFIYARKIKRYRTGNVRYRLKQNVTNAGIAVISTS
ncbi:MAG: hypothetical protein ACLTKZ_07255, partial [Lachnospiraceae bacterium]